MVLKSATAEATVWPSTLQVEARLGVGPSMRIAVGQDDIGPAADVTQSSDRISWMLPKPGLGVSAVLAGEDVTFEFRASKPGAFTWPVVDLAPPAKALIWPHWEGRFVPLDDPQWRAFLAGQEWDTTEGLCMPFWGVLGEKSCVTYLATNRYNNEIKFVTDQGAMQLRFQHEFPPSEKEWVYGFVIHLGDGASPVEPARFYRDWLTRRGDFVSMRDKMKVVPKAERLLGAVHAYLWGDAFLTRHDLQSAKWQELCRTIISQANGNAPSVGKRIHTLMSVDGRQCVEQIASTQWPDRYRKSQLADELSRVLERPDFYEASAWQGTTLPAEVQPLLERPRESLSIAETCRMNAMLLRAAFPDAMLPVADWGNGVSLKMLRTLKDAGLERVRLCLPGWEGVEKRPEVAKAADEMGYLFGTYDSFHSIHDPAIAGTEATWPTAQFNQALYEHGAIQKQDGTKRAGFKRKGYVLSPLAARADVERRVRQNMQHVPYNHYFVDCDAFGQVFDDYSPEHLCTQARDAAARVDRMDWIARTFNVVVGSEGGSSYAAPAIHIAEGVFMPGVGWGDAEMADKKSPYYLGNYYPPDGPQVFCRPVPLKDVYVRLHCDPRFLLPLNEIVFHDSFVSTHHWSSGSLKFSNVSTTMALMGALYQCPPMYHLNLDEWERQRATILAQYRFFSPVHREVGFARMTDFAWLSADRLVQKTVFDDRVEIVANFGDTVFGADTWHVPPRSVTARWRDGGKTLTYTPAPATQPRGQ